MKKSIAGVALIAWVWIVTGGLMAVGTLLSLAFGGMEPALGEIPGLPAEAAPLLDAVDLLFRWWIPLNLLQLVFGVVSLVAGVRLLALRNWAALMLEGLSWVSVVGSFGIATLGGMLWVRLLAGFPPEVTEFDLALARNAGIGVWVGIGVLAAAPFAWMALYLRTSKVRSLFKIAAP